MHLGSDKCTIVTVLAAARKVANENGFDHVDAVAAEFRGHYLDEHRWRVAFVRPSDSEDHGLQFWIVFLDFDNNQASIEHGFDLPFPRTYSKRGDNYGLPWPSRFDVSIDDAIRIAAIAPSEGCFGPRELADIAAVCFEQAPMDPKRTMANQWHVVFHYEWKEGFMAGRLGAGVFLIDIHTGARRLLPIGYSAWCNEAAGLANGQEK